MAGEEKQARKVVAKEKRNSKVSTFGRAVVELEEGLRVLLQNNTTKLFNIEGQVVRVCEGGRSAYIRARNKGSRTTTFLRNRRFMDYDPRFRADRDVAMATVEGAVGSKNCLPLRHFCRKTGSAAKRARGAVSSILKGTLSKLSMRIRTPGPAAGLPKRKTVSWAQSVGI